MGNWMTLLSEKVDPHFLCSKQIGVDDFAYYFQSFRQHISFSKRETSEDYLKVGWIITDLIDFPTLLSVKLINSAVIILDFSWGREGAEEVLGSLDGAFRKIYATQSWPLNMMF